MDKTIIKNKVLVNKLKEYFSKHPDKKSVVLKADLKESKIFWRAELSADRVKITEVRTTTSDFDFVGNDLNEIVSGMKGSKIQEHKKTNETK